MNEGISKKTKILKEVAKRAGQRYNKIKFQKESPQI